MDRPVAINGAGMIGNTAMKLNFQGAETGADSLPITHVVDGYFNRDQVAENLQRHPIYGPSGLAVTTEGNDIIVVGQDRLKFVSASPDATIDWKSEGVWGVMEGTGKRVDMNSAGRHISDGGAEKVYITAPAKEAEVPSLIVGFNDGEYDPGKMDVVQGTSCTTKSAIHAIEALNRAFGVESVLLTTTHAETGRDMENLMRGLNEDEARNLGAKPAKTGAAVALGRLLEGIPCDAIADRIPTIDGSLSHIFLALNKSATPEEVREVLKAAVQSRIFAYVDKLASSRDLVGRWEDSVAVGDSVRSAGKQVHLTAGYDNIGGSAAAALRAMSYMRARE